MRGNARNPARREPLRDAFEQIDPEPTITALEELVTAARRERLKAVLADRLESVTILMDAPHDPHNGAAVLRSCDAFGVFRLHVVERAEAFSASNAVAKGAERWVDVIAHDSTQNAVSALRAGDYRLIGTHPQGELLPAQLQQIPRLALVMGNEHDGICKELIDGCDGLVRVPMRGFVESLNVSVSAAILLAHATLGRSGDVPELQLRRMYARSLVLSVPRALDILEALEVDLLTRMTP